MAPILSRYVPPSVYVDGAKISAKVIVLIVILIIITLFFSTLICYICIKRRQIRKRRLRREKEERDNKQLKARINGRNAKFYAPGLAMGSRSDSGVTSGSRLGSERARGWKDGLIGKVDKGVLDRWNMREKEYELESGSDRGSLHKKRETDFEDIEIPRFEAVRKPERVWVKWGRK
ncbi:hypothetical protein VTL71DRAFT_11418 [Oculimacula yallundae]|uniref:Uncharacterized protein n=1 Tax=Oculimacula yallundae TaxID=86028 RepID=A0ABR4CQ70_9HELO